MGGQAATEIEGGEVSYQRQYEDVDGIIRVEPVSETEVNRLTFEQRTAEIVEQERQDRSDILADACLQVFRGCSIYTIIKHPDYEFSDAMKAASGLFWSELGTISCQSGCSVFHSGRHGVYYTLDMR